MASSFASQIPAITHLVGSLKPKTVLDIGKGFGKYGFLIHEYAGIDNQTKLDPSKTMAEQSQVRVEAVEVDADLMLPHLSQLYARVHFGDVLKLYPELPKYDLILMIDIIEHINKEQTLPMLRHFLEQGSNVIVSTPVDFFEQHLYESVFENHVSHWTIKDFRPLGFTDVQYFDSGAVYLLSPGKLDIRGFGSGLLKKIRRIGRLLKNELQ
jgi:SAM-dependent methyltransferase